jgi:hypothetical protein
MEEGSFSANGVKHCIRPCDMTGKSSAVILRQMHPNVVQEATRYDRSVDLPMWLSTLSLDSNSVPYFRQKELECINAENLKESGGVNWVEGTENSYGSGEKKKRGRKCLTQSQ